jgi:Domain of unknown function (DUF397)
MDLAPRTWRTSSYSSSSGDNCVEVGTAARSVAVRDSKDPYNPGLTFRQAAWRKFTRTIKTCADG